MMTNTYLPHVGGVARSVETFAEEYRRLGHEVLIVAPEFPDTPAEEEHVVRVPAIQRFNGSDFSVRLPIPGMLHGAVTKFQPDVIHAHHPFLLGDTAQRLAALRNVPLVFTHHTMYEQYTHYVPGDSPALKRFVIDLATHYANLCDQVIAPSESIARVLQQRGVKTPITAIPTGVDVERFAAGDGRRVRDEFQIPAGAWVVGHVGRLAAEKNLPLLAKAVSRFLQRNRQAYFLVVGTGPSERDIEEACRLARVDERLRLAGTRQGQQLVDAYHAMNVFAFASTSETQGMVLTEAMAAGVPVVAIDAPGAREVVRDGENGRLLSSHDADSLAAALQWVAERPDAAQLSAAARQTAEQFSQRRCAQRALDLYEALIGTVPSVASDETTVSHAWESALRLIEAEYHVWESRAAAARTVVQGEFLVKMPIFRWLRHYWRRLRRAVSRNEWAAPLLKLSHSKGTAIEPGLILVQIDGLSRTQLERALERRNMPFLRRLLRREGYHLHTMYSGLPSSTPAVQGELFYGIRGAVPAFSFRDHQTNQIARMYEQRVAADVQRRLARDGLGLLEGGSAYCNVYSGGAAEAHFCAATLGWGDFLRAANPLALVLFILSHAMSVLRILGLLGIEFCLAVVDFFRGIIAGHNLLKELKFIPTRVGICVLLRELVTIGASVDATRGLPIVHVNLIGYDEQAHRRGPTSAFAHWSLKGLDYAIRRIWSAAHRSRHRDYVFWVYSDHGQEEVVPYPVLTGKTVDQAVAEIAAPELTAASESQICPDASAPVGVEHHRSSWLGEGVLHRWFGNRPPLPTDADPTQERLVVAAMGPVAHVYFPDCFRQASRETQDRIARKLTSEAQVPCVLAVREGQVVAWTGEGRLQLPDDAHCLLGASHPFRDEVAAELVALCQHPDAGDLVLCGWRAGQSAVSFPHEQGAHGGFGPEETRAFALLPPELNVPSDIEFLRPDDLRRFAYQTLHPHYVAESPPPRVVAASDSRPQPPHHPSSLDAAATLRILTYNVHSCIGMDGKLSPQRIARVIARCRPDVVALQEVDVGRRQSGGMDQAHLIAHELAMDHHFHAAWQVEEERYGNAVLSRLPLELVQAATLDGPIRRRGEPRGAIWVQFECGGEQVHLINTHLGLSASERAQQVETLLSEQWLGAPDLDGPLILCGDFNMRPATPGYRRLSRLYRDAQVAVDRHRPRSTWSSTYPWRRIDHVFISPHFEAVAADIRQSHLARIASDHLPVLIELRLATSAVATRAS